MPDVEIKTSKKLMKAMYNAISGGLVEACHDCSEGGFITAISEMAFAGELGVNINADLIKTDDNKMTLAEKLFSESNTRFVVEVSDENSEKFEKILKGFAFEKVGHVTDNQYLVLESKKSKIVIKENIKNLQKAWQKQLF